MAAYTTSTKKSSATRAGGCHCKEEPELPCSCCKTSCFERPQYHCGHLLSSDDLTLQLRYDMEKNKLRNRTLFGCGVVCGLRLTCDPDCCGTIRIGKGYALDACGNDLVACESERFNVMERLREKGLIGCPPPVPDPCSKEDQNTDDDDCPEKQCFYIVACYSEEEDVFESPFQSGCDPKPAACVPTRIKERISFDVVTKAPGCGCNTDLLKFSLPKVTAMEEGPLGDYLQQNSDTIAQITAGGQMPSNACEILCNIVRLFRRQLSTAPAEYTCSMGDAVNKIKCPEANSNTFAADMGTAMQDLLNLIYQYSVELAMGDMVFDCCEPDESGCVVLGAVYVENGKLIRVCNMPRDYVWTFNNLVKIAQIELMNYALKLVGRRQGSTSCCPVLKFDASTLQKRIAYSRTSMSDSVSAFPNALDSLRTALAESFNFADAENFSAGDISAEKLKQLNFDLRDGGRLDATASQTMLRDPIAAFASHMLIRSTDPILSYSVADPKNQTERIIMRDPTAVYSVDSASATTTTSGNNVDVVKQIAELKASLAETQRKLDAITAAVGTSKTPAPAAPPAPAAQTTKTTPKKDK